MTSRSGTPRRRPRPRRQATWRTVLVSAVGLGTLVTLAAAGLGAMLSGTGAAAGASVGGGTAVVLTGISLLLVEITERRAPQLTLPVFMLGFAVKVSVLALVLMLVPSPEGLDAGWAVGAVASVVLVQQAAVVRGFASMRLAVSPVTDP